MSAQEIINHLQNEIRAAGSRMEYNRGYIHGLELAISIVKDLQKGAENEHHNNEDQKH